MYIAKRVTDHQGIVTYSAHTIKHKHTKFILAISTFEVMLNRVTIVFFFKFKSPKVLYSTVLLCFLISYTFWVVFHTLFTKIVFLFFKEIFIHNDVNWLKPWHFNFFNKMSWSVILVGAVKFSSATQTIFFSSILHNQSSVIWVKSVTVESQNIT